MDKWQELFGKEISSYFSNSEIWKGQIDDIILMYFQFLCFCFCFDFILCNTSSESSLGLTNVTCRDVESNFIYFESFKHFQNLTNLYAYSNGWKVWSNVTTSVPKSVLGLVFNKVRHKSTKTTPRSFDSLSLSWSLSIYKSISTWHVYLFLLHK